MFPKNILPIGSLSILSFHSRWEKKSNYNNIPATSSFVASGISDQFQHV